MGFLSSIFGSPKQTVTQTSTNQTEVNTAVTVENDIIIDTDPLAKAFNGIKETLFSLGILSLVAEEQKIKTEAETAAVVGILEAKQNQSIAQGLQENFNSLFRKAGKFIGVGFGVWALLKVISIIRGKK